MTASDEYETPSVVRRSPKGALHFLGPGWRLGGFSIRQSWWRPLRAYFKRRRTLRGQFSDNRHPQVSIQYRNSFLDRLPRLFLSGPSRIRTLPRGRTPHFWLNTLRICSLVRRFNRLLPPCHIHRRLSYLIPTTLRWINVRISSFWRPR